MAITTAKGTLLKISNTASPPTYATIGQVRSITGPSVKPHIVDITTHDTPSFWRRKMAVLVDGGDISATINFDKTDATHAFTTGLWNQMVGLVQSSFQLVFPATAGTIASKGYVAGCEFEAPVDNVLAAKITMSLTDAITAS